MDWEQAFIATSVLLGEPIEAIRASLGPSLPVGATRLFVRLEAPSRDARAQALARVVADVAMAVDVARLA
jgi:hypothetical protein